MKAEHYAAMREAIEALPQQEGPEYDPTPDGYYARPEVPDSEVREALAKARIYLPARGL